MDTSTSPHVTAESSDSILHLRFNRPKLNYAMLDDIALLARRAQEEESVRLLRLDIALDGDDVEDMGPWPKRFAGRNPSGSHGPGPLIEQDAITALRGFMKPSIAVMDGPTNGVAIDIASVCDVRVASTNASFTDTRIVQGRAAATGIAYVLPRLIGLSQAMRILLLGETIAASEAERIQFVHKVFDDDHIGAKADALCQRLANMPTRAWEVHKLQVLPQLDMSFDAAMVHSMGVRQTHVIEDRVEGIAAWRERREPRFSGT